MYVSVRGLNGHPLGTASTKGERKKEVKKESQKKTHSDQELLKYSWLRLKILLVSVSGGLELFSIHCFAKVNLIATQT